MHRFAIGLMVLLAACTQGPADEANSYCQPLCRCIEPLPAAQRECATACVTLFEQAPAAEACVTCVAGHANRCTTLDEDCSALCRRPVPLYLMENRNELGIEDR